MADARGAQPLSLHEGFEQLLCVNVDQPSRMVGKFLEDLALAIARLQVDDHPFG